MRDKVTASEAAGQGRVIAFPPRFDAGGGVWEPWVDERVIARHFGTSARTIRRWRELGMPSRRFGGARRYRVSECEAWHAREGDAA